jgi:predicted PurR-regulated permease PerM
LQYSARDPVADSIPAKTNVVIILAAIVVVIYGMQSASAIIIPFLVATFLALITVRPMLWLQQHRVPTVLAALMIVLAILGVIMVVGVVVGRSLAAFTAALPGYQEQLQDRIDVLIAFIAQYTDDDRSIESLGDLINPGWAMGLAAGLLNAVRDVLTNTLLITFTMIFILLEASNFGTKVEAAFGRSASSLEGPRQFLDDLTSYLGIKTLVSMVTGLLIWLLTWWIGLDFPQLWGMLAFLLNYVPTIGSIIAAVPAVLLAIVQLGLGEATAVAVSFLAVNITFGNFIEPRLMGYGVGISPLIIFVRWPGFLGLGIRPGRDAALGTAVDVAEARAGERRAHALDRDFHRITARRAARRQFAARIVSRKRSTSLLNLASNSSDIDAQPPGTLRMNRMMPSAVPLSSTKKSCSAFTAGTI